MNFRLSRGCRFKHFVLGTILLCNVHVKSMYNPNDLDAPILRNTQPHTCNTRTRLRPEPLLSICEYPSLNSNESKRSRSLFFNSFVSYSPSHRPPATIMSKKLKTSTSPTAHTSPSPTLNTPASPTTLCYPHLLHLQMSH